MTKLCNSLIDKAIEGQDLFEMAKLILSKAIENLCAEEGQFLSCVGWKQLFEFKPYKERKTYNIID